MADEKIENGQEMEEVKPLSLFDEKMKGLLDDLDERLEQIGGDFGPILMEVYLYLWALWTCHQGLTGAWRLILKRTVQTLKQRLCGIIQLLTLSLTTTG